LHARIKKHGGALGLRILDTYSYHLFHMGYAFVFIHSLYIYCGMSKLVTFFCYYTFEYIYIYIYIHIYIIYMTKLIVCTLNSLITNNLKIPRPQKSYIISDLLSMSDCWLEVSIRKVLRPATSTQVFLGFPLSTSES